VEKPLDQLKKLWENLSGVKKIIAVDDEEDYCLTLKRNIELQGGFSVTTCSHSLEAQGMIHELKPDLVILDILMPGICGSDIAELLKQDPDTKNIPVIFLTALITEEEMEQRQKIENQYFLSKPIKIKDLMSTIHIALKTPTHLRQQPLRREGTN